MTIAQIKGGYFAEGPAGVAGRRRELHGANGYLIRSS
jgi:hypothetical protein